MFFALGIEVSGGRFEVRAFTLRDLMEVDRMFSGREVMEVKFERNARSLVPYHGITDVFALSVFEFDLSLGRAQRWKGEKREEQSEAERGKAFHEFDPPGCINYSEFVGSGISPFELMMECIVHKDVEYTAKKF
jgi:hypothetical protein